MGYEFKTDLNIEYPFFIEMASRLGGIKRRDNFNDKETFQVQCPNCKKHKAVMGYARSKDTYVLACPVDGCTLNGVVLHDLIKRYGGDEMFGGYNRYSYCAQINSLNEIIPSQIRDVLSKILVNDKWVKIITKLENFFPKCFS